MKEHRVPQHSEMLAPRPRLSRFVRNSSVRLLRGGTGKPKPGPSIDGTVLRRHLANSFKHISREISLFLRFHRRINETLVSLLLSDGLRERIHPVTYFTFVSFGCGWNYAFLFLFCFFHFLPTNGRDCCVASCASQDYALFILLITLYCRSTRLQILAKSFLARQRLLSRNDFTPFFPT